MGRDLLKVVAASGPEGPALWARRDRSGPEGPERRPEGPAMASVARPLYLKLLTRHTKCPRLDRQNTATRQTKYRDNTATRQTKMPLLDRQKCRT